MFHIRTMDNQELHFHQDFTLPLMKKVCMLGVIALVANNIFGNDYIAKGAIVMTMGFVVSRFLKGLVSVHINAIAEQKIGESK